MTSEQRPFKNHIGYFLSYLVLAVVLFITLAKTDPWGKQRFNHQVIQWDISLYYLYLPATFIYHDLGVEEEWPVDLGQYQISLNRSDLGRNTYKMTAGMAMVYVPGFLLGHAWALASPTYEANGFSLPYEKALISWMLLFALIGGWFLFTFLSRFVHRGIALVVVAIMLLGTNLFYYTLWDGAMAHSAGFSIISIVLELSMRFKQKRHWYLAAIIGLLVGVALLIRPTNAIPLSVPLLMVLLSFKSDWQRLAKPAAIGFVFLLLPWIIQVWTWKYTTGHWINYGYGEEGFFWSDPQIIRGFFSWRKGWLIYTPVMVFALLGFVSLRKLNKSWYQFIFGGFIVHVYVTFSWWCWWYGGGYGQRAMIEFYPLLALPMAAFIHDMSSKKTIQKWVFAATVSALVTYNIFTSWQAAKSIIHWDSMTFQAYKAMFLSSKFPYNYGSLLDPPDYEAALKGDRDQ